MHIRPLQQEDIPPVATLFRHVFMEAGEAWNEESAFRHVEQNFFGDAHWVAEDEEIIGMLMGIVLVREEGPELFIDTVAVAPEYQNKGVGKALWEEAERYVKAKNLKGIRLLANPGLHSYSWYKHMGFAESGWVELFRKS